MDNNSKTLLDIMAIYTSFKEDKLMGRFICNDQIEPLLRKHQNNFEIEKIGFSVNKEQIHGIKIGSGPTKVLGWSQMHGNESTTTKAIFDLLNVFNLNPSFFSDLWQRITLYIVPILNPDGARLYKRFNYNVIDLNRDAQNLTQPESKLLKSIFDDFKPDFCLNLHGQRTIFSAGAVKKSAILSFLTPSEDAEREITKNREKSMAVIANIASDLKEDIPEHIGRYDDSFNLNCTGDTFQNRGVPTLLFEAGHFPNDYNREETRKLVVKSILSALFSIASGDYLNFTITDYLNIPENEKLFNDIILRNVDLDNQIVDIAIQYSEILNENKIQFTPIINKIAPKIINFGHREIDCTNKKVRFEAMNIPVENDVVNKILLNDQVFML
ncbi:M14 metallopeptidase family protein [Zunongwangia sp.]|uniref:M14 family metallopeptidase n=1 Tax=Zunongwangia sp. TaxID=1965325 RepID=UPI003AA9CE07